MDVGAAMPGKHLISLLAVLSACAAAAGCMTPRMEAKLDRFPRNRVFRAAELPAIGEEGYVFGEYDRGGEQSLCLLQLAPDTRLAKRFHAGRDLTLFVVAGSAIVQVEETRYFVNPGDAVLLPRYTAYAVLPHMTEVPFSALLVYSPPYDQTDVTLED
jgi:mannose-6-phosphate isomerase-like protein (cupin superfamily)